MASIVMDEIITAAPDAVWAGLSAFGQAHRVFAGVLIDCALESGDVRTVTFANGAAVRERLIGLDHERRRIAYSALNFAHHNAAFEVCPHLEGSRVIWSCDVLPHEAGEQIRPLMQAGLAAMRRAFA